MGCGYDAGLVHGAAACESETTAVIQGGDELDPSLWFSSLGFVKTNGGRCCEYTRSRSAGCGDVSMCSRG